MEAGAGQLETTAGFNDKKTLLRRRSQFELIAALRHAVRLLLEPMSRVQNTACSKKPTTNWRFVLLVAALCVTIPNLSVFYSQRDLIRAGMLDFRIFYAGATSFLSNGGTNLYDYDSQSRVQKQLYPTTSMPGFVVRPMALPYNHPPFELLLFLPLAFLPSLHAYYLWTVISLVLCILCCRLLGRQLKHMSAFWPAMPYAIVLCGFPLVVVLLQGQDAPIVCCQRANDRTDGRFVFE